jgi:hypothetical protein
MAIGSRYSSSMPDYYGQIEDSALQGSKIGARYGSMLSDAMHQGFMEQDQENQITRRNAARKAFGDAWASGDPKAIERAMQQFPEFAEQAQKFIGVRDEQHRKDLGSLMAEINAHAQAGDYQGVLNLIDKNGHILDSDSSTLLKNIATAATSADKNTADAARQKLLGSTGAIANIANMALTPQEREQDADRNERLKLDYLREGESEQRDRWAHDDRGLSLREREAYHGQMLNLRSQMTDKQQEIADRMNWNAWGGNNKDSIKQLASTLQAEGRLQSALNTGTPIGDVSAMLQFMVQEAPRLSPRIGQAMGISSEAAAGILQRAQQTIKDLQNGRKLQPQQIKDLKTVSAAMKQSVQNSYYSLVSPALVGVDLANTKQAQEAMKRTNLPLSALKYIQDHADQYDQYGFGSGVPGVGNSGDSSGGTDSGKTVDFGDLKK